MDGVLDLTVPRAAAELCAGADGIGGRGLKL